LYTNDQPIPNNTKNFLYADDLAIIAQDTSFKKVQDKLVNTLEAMNEYYNKNQLKPNPNKTQLYCFHLRNRDAKKQINIKWLGNTLYYIDYPVYLGVTLDRTLTFKEHCIRTKMKVQTRNNLLKKLLGTQWGARPHTMQTTKLALYFSAGEYACPVCSRPKHVKHVNTALNNTCRAVTGCLQPTQINKIIYFRSGIAPPEIRRSVATDLERTKQFKRREASHV